MEGKDSPMTFRPRSFLAIVVQRDLGTPPPPLGPMGPSSAGPHPPTPTDPSPSHPNGLSRPSVSGCFFLGGGSFLSAVMYQGYVPGLCTRVVYQGCVPGLCTRVVYQGYVPELCTSWGSESGSVGCRCLYFVVLPPMEGKDSPMTFRPRSFLAIVV